ncbi:uncharacterized protein [Diabrotica undecimpunctata]|uniref:uncharacterized protein n=1 Tax=Diabrotica undecimpunctata TaxID=50387 RepID=UPI003B63DF03
MSDPNDQQPNERREVPQEQNLEDRLVFCGRHGHPYLLTHGPHPQVRRNLSVPVMVEVERPLPPVTPLPVGPVPVRVPFQRIDETREQLLDQLERALEHVFSLPPPNHFLPRSSHQKIDERHSSPIIPLPVAPVPFRVPFQRITETDEQRLRDLEHFLVLPLPNNNDNVLPRSSHQQRPVSAVPVEPVPVRVSFQRIVETDDQPLKLELEHFLELPPPNNVLPSSSHQQRPVSAGIPIEERHSSSTISLPVGPVPVRVPFQRITETDEQRLQQLEHVFQLPLPTDPLPRSSYQQIPVSAGIPIDERHSSSTTPLPVGPVPVRVPFQRIVETDEQRLQRELENFLELPPSNNVLPSSSHQQRPVSAGIPIEERHYSSTISLPVDPVPVRVPFQRIAETDEQQLDQLHILELPLSNNLLPRSSHQQRPVRAGIPIDERHFSPTIPLPIEPVTVRVPFQRIAEADEQGVQREVEHCLKLPLPNNLLPRCSHQQRPVRAGIPIDERHFSPTIPLPVGPGAVRIRVRRITRRRNEPPRIPQLGFEEPNIIGFNINNPPRHMHNSRRAEEVVPRQERAFARPIQYPVLPGSPRRIATHGNIPPQLPIMEWENQNIFVDYRNHRRTRNVPQPRRAEAALGVAPAEPYLIDEPADSAEQEP